MQTDTCLIEPSVRRMSCCYNNIVSNVLPPGRALINQNIPLPGIGMARQLEKELPVAQNDPVFLAAFHLYPFKWLCMSPIPLLAKLLASKVVIFNDVKQSKHSAIITHHSESLNWSNCINWNPSSQTKIWFSLQYSSRFSRQQSDGN